MPLRALALLLIAAAAGGCGRSTAPSAEQNAVLDDAGRMLDEAPDKLNAVDDAGIASNRSAETGEQR